VAPGFTWLDWLVVIVVAGFALRGLFRGTIGQVFGLLGLIAGLYTAAWIGQWVGHHWNSARPAAVFWLLRWLVAILGGLAVASLFEWMSHLAREAIHETPAKWLDRLGGLVVGTALGLIVSAAVVVTVVLSAWPAGFVERAARGRFAAPLVQGASWAYAAGGKFLPGSGWVRPRLETAERRTHAGNS
jgi:membrane protein required for colicin V production